MPRPYLGQVQLVHRIDHLRRVQLGVLVVGVGLVYGELNRLGHAGREEGLGPVLVGEELPPGFLVGLGVVVLDEAAGASYKVEPHQVAPVVGVLAEVEGRQGARRGLMTPAELHLAQFAQVPLGPNAQVLIVLHEHAQLVGQVQVGLVIRSGR